jgi:cell wall-associated NlpC family hydrolase
MVNFMPTKKFFFFIVIFFGFNASLLAQKSVEQKLDVLLAQGHFKMVYRRAGRLMMDPAYDQSQFPAKYRQLAAQELAKNPVWAKRHASELDEMPKPSTTQTAQGFKGSVQTQKLLQEAQRHLGVPYKEAGMDPSGFDCSGFTCYVFESSGVTLPRRAADQYAFCQKITPEEARAGDLVFFSNGGQVNHVGILISEKGTAKQMIHSSSSVGISVVELETSTYWKPKIVGYGRIK